MDMEELLKLNYGYSYEFSEYCCIYDCMGEVKYTVELKDSRGFFEKMVHLCSKHYQEYMERKNGE